MDNNNSFDRRKSQRFSLDLPGKVSFAAGTQEICAKVLDLSLGGESCVLDNVLPSNIKFVKAILEKDGSRLETECSLAWRDDANKKYGLTFKEVYPETSKLIEEIQNKFGDIIEDNRDRKSNRRSRSSAKTNDIRKQVRRFYDLLAENQNQFIPNKNPTKILLRKKSALFTEETLRHRREWLAQETDTKFKHIQFFSETIESMQGNIENPIGVAHVPLGVAGPLQVNGEYAKGVFYVPLATTEGALVTSYTLGASLITRAGGSVTKIERDLLCVSPVFVFENLKKAQLFIQWLKSNFEKIKQIAESTTSHGKLLSLEPLHFGHRVILKFIYSTGDAMGMNMVCKATHEVCKMIVPIVNPIRFFLRSNYSSNKKVSYGNIISGYGKSVMAEVIIPRHILKPLNITPEKMVDYYQDTIQSSLHSGMVGANGHFANGLTALYIACGQDVATVSNSCSGVTLFEVTNQGDLYVNVNIPNLLLGTIGGGTHFGTAKECLSMLGCLGNGKAKKFAEITASTVLAGEISITASIANGTYVYAHEIYGRNKNK